MLTQDNQLDINGHESAKGQPTLYGGFGFFVLLFSLYFLSIHGESSRKRIRIHQDAGILTHGEGPPNAPLA